MSAESKLLVLCNHWPDFFYFLSFPPFFYSSSVIFQKYFQLHSPLLQTDIFVIPLDFFLCCQIFFALFFILSFSLLFLSFIYFLKIFNLFSFFLSLFFLLFHHFSFLVFIFSFIFFAICFNVMFIFLSSSLFHSYPCIFLFYFFFLLFFFFCDLTFYFLLFFFFFFYYFFPSTLFFIPYLSSFAFIFVIKY